MLTDRQKQKRHARKRFAERLGVQLSNDEINEIILNIKENRYRCLGRQGKNTTVWDSYFNEKRFVSFYDENLCGVRTVYTVDMYNRNREKIGCCEI